jgi:uncharacterized protein
MSERFPQLFWGMIALAAGLVVASALTAGAVKSIRRSDDVIEVTGSARRPIRSDIAVWRVSVTMQGASVQEASAGLTEPTQRVLAFLRQNAVPDSVVTMGSLEPSPIYRILENGTTTGEVLGYRVSQGFEVRSTDVNGIKALVQRADVLTREGVPLSFGQPEYLYTRLAEVRTQMLADATEDAHRRAEAIATSVGSEIGGVRSARSGVFQITPRNSTEVSDYGINDTSALEKDITAVVRVSFAVD